MSELASVPPARLVTVFGTVLYMDTASGELRQGQHGSSPANAAFVADPGSPGPPRRGWLMHDADGAPSRLSAWLIAVSASPDRRAKADRARRPCWN